MMHRISVFGKPEGFAIQHRECTTAPSGWTYAFCHMVLNGELIGDFDEECVVGTWFNCLQNLYEQTAGSMAISDRGVLDGLSDREIFEMVHNSNKEDSEIEVGYRYLPKHKDNSLWVAHVIDMDETTQAYSIIALKEQANIKIIWEKWRGFIEGEKLNQLKTVILNYEEFRAAILECLTFLNEKYQLNTLKQ